MQRPQFIGTAIQLIWLTLGLDALTMVANYDGTAANLDSLTFNGTMLIFYAFVTLKIAVGRNWARRSYAFLVAMEFALVAAYGLSDATELEVLLTVGARTIKPNMAE